MGARRVRVSVLVALVCLFAVASACGEPELSDEAKAAKGSGDPTGSAGSPLPGIPPRLPSGGVPPLL